MLKPILRFTTADNNSQVLQVNLNTVFTLCRDTGAYMLTRKPKGSPPHRGSIINIASLVSFQGGLNVPAYACAKGGVAQLTKSLSNQVSKLLGIIPSETVETCPYCIQQF